MPARHRQQVCVTPELREKVRQLGELWRGVEGPLTPSAVFRVAVERCYLRAMQELQQQPDLCRLRVKR